MNKPASKLKDKAWEEYTSYLESELKKVKQSPYYKTYKTILNQVDNWNEQLTITGEEESYIVAYDKEGSPIYAKRQKGAIDIFGSKDDKEFDRAMKFFLEVNSLLEHLDKMRSKLTPEDKQALEREEQLNHTGTLERFLTKVKTS
jgi:hypothetical protein